LRLQPAPDFGESFAARLIETLTQFPVGDLGVYPLKDRSPKHFFGGKATQRLARFIADFRFRQFPKSWTKND
jgi:hypothetical protein